MNFDRRKFLKTTGSAALVATLPFDPIVALIQSSEQISRKLVVGILSEPAFPQGEIPFLSRDEVSNSFKEFEVRSLSVMELKEQLLVGSFDVVINPYGSRFPKELWGTLYKYLKKGGNWINLGGVPFSIPVVRDGNGWREEIPQVAYHKKLGITQSFPVPTAGLMLQGFPNDSLQAEQVFELYYRFTDTRDFSNEDGPAGARDATIKALAYCETKDKKKIAAPVVQIDRMQGDFAGGRWVLANFKGTITVETIRLFIQRASLGANEMVLRCSFGCYYENETPSFTIQFRKPKGESKLLLQQVCELEITNERNKQLERAKITLIGNGTIATGYYTSKERSLSPGLYRVKARQKILDSNTGLSDTVTYTTGFWMYDRKLMESGKPLTTNETYFLRDGEVYPVTGTSYMGSDVHRKFLFEPNPLLWDNDFSEMKIVGINMVRTGIWTAWKNYMLDVGAPNETALRALDAFILCARKHNIPVIFTFFAFLPEMWGGENPYLDPRSVNAQKEFITIFAQRYKHVNDIIWDFINEPSFCNPQQLWTCRPNYDNHEIEAWTAWLKQRYPADSEERFVSTLQEMYRCAPGEELSLPALEEFNDVNIFNEKRPLKVIDYRIFAQEMFVWWTKEMTKAIRSNGNPHQLITVGQDEGGTYERPGPHFYEEAVDFTCLHNWWYNNDLLWDSVMTKAPGKPCLTEETGMMFYEKMDGSAWRNEEEVANLLEKKLALSLSAGGAGFIEWIWNTNPYMKSDNEAAIGLHRVDGTVKPEIDRVRQYAKFFTENKHLMKGRVHEDVVMIIPHSQMFSTRNYATEATQKCVRAMAYHCRVPIISVSEYRLDKLKTPPKLIIFPSPRTVNNTAWETLLNFVNQGTTLLVSGAIDTDDHWMPQERVKKLGVSSVTSPVTMEEFLTIEGKEFLLSYPGEKIQRIEKSVVDQNDTRIHQLQHGKGTIIWSPLPVELAQGIEPVAAFYALALRKAGIESLFTLENDSPSTLILPTVFSDSILFSIISETNRDLDIVINPIHANVNLSIHLLAQRNELIFVRRTSGTEITRLNKN